MNQGILPFQYEVEPVASGMTALAGLPSYLDLAAVCGLTDSIRQHLTVCSGKKQGFPSEQIVMSLILLNLAGGDRYDDLRLLEGDEGFAQVLRRVETHGLPRKERRALERRWRKKRRRAVPSESKVFRYLEAYHNQDEEEKRQPSKAFIPAPNEHLQNLQQVNTDMIAFAQQKNPKKTATLDMDATLVETHSLPSLFCYKGYKSYQPLNTYWFEQNLVVHSEFRDGNVPAGYEQLRVFKEGLERFPEGVEEVYLRSDTAGYQHEWRQNCAEGKNERFGVIQFAIGVDVTPAFKLAVADVKEHQWHPLYQEIGPEYRIKTNQEWAEGGKVPNGLATQKDEPNYRFMNRSESLEQKELFSTDTQQLPFPTMEFNDQGHYKVFGTVTNRSCLLPLYILIESIFVSKTKKHIR